MIGLAAMLTVLAATSKLIERHLFPVFTEIEFVLVKSTETKSDLLFRGVKSRACLLMSATAVVDISGRKIQVTPIMLKEDGSRLEFDEQRISVDSRFVRVVRVPVAGTVESFSLTSQCHPFWLTEQVVNQQ